MKDIALNILKTKGIKFENIVAMGHHELNRNFVFHITGEPSYILKIYGKEIKYLCEKRALEIFEDFTEIPKLIDSSLEEEGSWILMSKIEGQLLGNLWLELTKEKRKELITAVGDLLGRIHSKETYDYFGLWQDFQSQAAFKDFLSYRKRNDRKIMTRILNQNLPDDTLFKKAYNELEHLYKRLNENVISTICHRDYSYRNMIIEKNQGKIRLKGIVDFEHCQIDDPAIDFNTLYQYDMINDSIMEEAFFKGYERYMSKPVDFADRKKYYMLNLGLHTCSWSYEAAPDFYRRGVRILKENI